MSKIISILFLVILIIGLPVGIYLALNKTQFFSKAGSDDVPRDVKITNISDNSFTLTWQTLKPVIGFISYGSGESLGSTAADDRDSTGPKSYSTHHVTVKNLNPSANYYFKIGSGSKAYDDNGKAYTQQTAPSTQQPPAVPDPIIGKVISKGEGVAEVLVYATTSNSTLLSSYTRKDGNFLITLNNARTEDLAAYIEVSDQDQITIEVVSDSGKATKTIKASERGEPISISLTEGSELQDLNGDGKINSVDRLLQRQKKP